MPYTNYAIRSTRLGRIALSSLEAFDIAQIELNAYIQQQADEVARLY